MSYKITYSIPGNSYGVISVGLFIPPDKSGGYAQFTPTE